MSKHNSWYTMQAQNTAAEVSIYDEIGFWGVTAKDFLRDLQALGPVEAITLRLNSGGGDVLDGFAIYNALRRHEGKIIAHIDGIAASMASIIACAADEIHIAENAWFMIHNPATVAFGEADDLRTMADVMDGMKAHAIAAYQRHVDEDAEIISAWMDAETWLTGADATALGWRMQVGEELKAVAQLRTPRFAVHEDAAAHFTAAETEPKPASEKSLETLAADYEAVASLVTRHTELEARTAVAEAETAAKLEELQAKLAEAETAQTSAEAARLEMQSRIDRLAPGQKTPEIEAPTPDNFRSALAAHGGDYVAARLAHPEIWEKFNHKNRGN